MKVCGNLALNKSIGAIFLIAFAQFPGGSDGKASAYNAGDLGLIPGSGRCPGEGNGNPLQYYCLENPMDRGVWEDPSPWGPKESDTTERLHFAHLISLCHVLVILTADKKMLHVASHFCKQEMLAAIKPSVPAAAPRVYPEGNSG